MRFLIPLIAAVALVCTGSIRAELPDDEALLKRGGADAVVIIQKARSILASVQVFASREIGEAGSPTASCWALTVIVRHDSEAKEFFNDLYRLGETPEQRLYAIAGLVSVDPMEKKRFTLDDISKFTEMTVHTQFGCISARSTFGAELASLLESSAPYYLFETLPSIYQTVDVARHPEPTK